MVARPHAHHLLHRHQPSRLGCRPALDRIVKPESHFDKKHYTWSPAIEGNYWLGHSYQIFRMTDAFRRMIRTRVEPVPHREILEVTAIINCCAKSLQEKGRFVTMAEVMG